MGFKDRVGGGGGASEESSRSGQLSEKREEKGLNQAGKAELQNGRAMALYPE